MKFSSLTNKKKEEIFIYCSLNNYTAVMLFLVPFFLGIGKSILLEALKSIHDVCEAKRESYIEDIPCPCLCLINP